MSLTVTVTTTELRRRLGDLQGNNAQLIQQIQAYLQQNAFPQAQVTAASLEAGGSAVKVTVTGLADNQTQALKNQLR